MRLVFYYVFELEQFYGCTYYFEPEEDTIIRFLKGLNFQIQNKMPTYTIYTLQHAIYLATQNESQIKTQYQRTLMM